ncbi:LysM peptidoglycan-binding domain-containing protein [Tepidiforma flava]|uniref:LysM peptidoglycan-binding domain-containing protein n=1 Tax=Tepidiforma flava TaxID=3004094 RepID=A0ABY7MA50_9CHLR|nr:LysM peptidoglycan-binding domain-containing protein [Tepidiforma flava]WBL37394.1 LysM peptidoglycan-binding domain-containing protein [Tepidiforma flava]
MTDATCHYCERPATADCPTCGRLYCEEHGAEVCLRCMAPEAAVPSARVFRGSLALLALATLVTAFLLIRPPATESRGPLVRELPSPTPAVTATATPTPRGGAPSPTAAAGGATRPPSTPPTPATAQPGSPTPTPAGATPTPAARTYVVKSGDTLFQIALDNGTTVDAILAVNPGLDPDTLSVGMEILLP